MPNSPPASKFTAPLGASVVVRTIDRGQSLQWLGLAWRDLPDVTGWPEREQN